MLLSTGWFDLCGVGGVFSSIFQRLWGKQEFRIIIVGLDGAGKTTILNRLQSPESIATIPSIS